MSEEVKAAPRFHTYYCDSYEFLKEALLSLLGSEVRFGEKSSGAASPGFFKNVTVVAPSNAVTQDLTHAFADKYGAVSGVRFMQTGEWSGSFLGRMPGGFTSSAELDWLLWLRLLPENGAFPEFMNGEKAAGLRQYLTAQDGVSPKPENDISRFMFARRLAQTFVKYSTYRLDWIYQWIGDGSGKQNPAPDRYRRELGHLERNQSYAWQRDLWDWLAEPVEDEARGVFPRWEGVANLRQAMRNEAEASAGRCPESLRDPSPLHVFTPVRLAPVMLPFLYMKSLHAPVYVYMLNPASSVYWFDPNDAVPRDEAEDAPRCDWLVQNAGQTRAMIDRLWRFTSSGEANPDEDELTGSPVLPAVSLFSPERALQDAQVFDLSGAYTSFSSDLTRFSGHAGGGRTMLDAVHRAVQCADTGFLWEERSERLENPQEREAWMRDLETPERGLPSLRIAASASLQREAESLADWIYALKEKGVRSSEILVVTPNLDEAAPVIDAVFRTLPESARIDYRIAGRAQLRSGSATETFGLAGDFICGRAGLDGFMEILSSHAVSSLWQFGEEDLALIREWLSRAGYSFGLSDRHVAEMRKAGAILDDENDPHPEETLERALERLAAGFAASGSDFGCGAWLDVRPVSGSRSAADRPELFSSLLRFAEALGETASLVLEHPEGETPEAWMQKLLGAADRLFPVKNYWDDDSGTESLKQSLVKLLGHAERVFTRAGETGRKVPFRIVLSALSGDARENRGPAGPDGAVTISGMEQMRTLPYKAVAVLGLNSDSGFPGTPKLDEFDLMGDESLRRRGDRDSRRDNRTVFFDLVMSARNYFAVFYDAGPNPRKPQPPSEVVMDFENFLSELFREFSWTGAAPWRVTLPLSSFSRRNFTDAALEKGCLGSSEEAFGALEERQREEGAPPEAAPFADDGLGLLETCANDVTAEELGRYFSGPERWACRTLGLAESSGSASDEAGILFPSSGLAVWQFCRDALEAWRAGISKERFVRARVLDPVFGVRPVREEEVRARAAQLYSALDAFGAGRGAVPERDEMLCTAESESGTAWRLFVPRRQDGEIRVAAASKRERFACYFESLIRSAGDVPAEIRMLDLSLAVITDAKKNAEAEKILKPLQAEPARKVLEAAVTLYEAALCRSKVLGAAYSASPFFRSPEEMERKEVLVQVLQDLDKTLGKMFASGGTEDALERLERMKSLLCGGEEGEDRDE